MEKIKVENHSLTAFSWFAGWLFAIGFLHLAFWKGARGHQHSDFLAPDFE